MLFYYKDHILYWYILFWKSFYVIMYWTLTRSCHPWLRWPSYSFHPKSFLHDELNSELPAPSKKFHFQNISLHYRTRFSITVFHRNEKTLILMSYITLYLLLFPLTRYSEYLFRIWSGTYWQTQYDFLNLKVGLLLPPVMLQIYLLLTLMYTFRL